MNTAPSAVTAHCLSPAKVNLCLRIVGRRADGYHLLDSIFAAIDFCDRIDLRVTDVRAGRDVRVQVRCDRPDVPSDATNLAARAAAILLDECGLGGDVDLSITKRIPPGAGLGGGSSNGATVLSMMNEQLRLGVAPTRLHALALALGADVPFFLTGGCARVRGIGERIEPIRGWPGRVLVLALPPVSVATAWAFRAYTAGLFPEAQEAALMATHGVLEPGLLRNDLEAAVLPNHPEIARLKASLLASGAAGSVMSGSGSAVVGLVADGESADAVASALRTRHPEAVIHVARILAAKGHSSVDPTASYA
jgi:4-diphosphocytidyl-2-C-methyl-D-erythritol kinase